MKIVRYAAATALLCVALAARASGDPVAGQSDPNVNPHAMEDADGVPLSVTQPKETGPTKAEVEARSQQEAKADADKDWLLRSYEQHQQADAVSSETENSNLYYRISSNSNLAKLAGVPSLEINSKPQAADFKTGVTVSGNGGVTLRDDPSSANFNKSPLVAFKPLITPLGAAEAGGLHNFYASPASTLIQLLPDSGSTKKVAPAAHTSPAQNSVVMESPGLTAAESDSLMDKASAPLTLDLPQDESPSESSHETLTQMSLPLTTNAGLLQKQNADALRVPGAKAAQPTPINVLKLNLQDEPQRDTVPQPSPIRQPIANPYDIFNR